MAYCNEPAPLSAAQNDRLIRFGAIVKAELERSGASVALIARSGLDLGRFGQRYSHAGVSLKAGPESPWAVRQLYFDCDERRPRLFDQGMAAFVLGGNEPTLGYVSVLLLPPAPAAALERTALDNRQALALLGRELQRQRLPLQPALPELQPVGGRAAGHRLGPRRRNAAARRTVRPTQRERAQAWLQGRRLRGHRLRRRLARADVGRQPSSPGCTATTTRPKTSSSRSTASACRPRSRPSCGASCRARRGWSSATPRRQVVIRRGWEPIAEGCQAGAQDTVISLE